MRRRRFMGLLVVVLALAGQAMAQVPDAISVLIVHGQREVRLNAAELARLPRTEQAVTLHSGRAETTSSFVGVPLWSVLQAAGVLEGTAGRDRIQRVLRVVGRDGYVAALALAEIDPDFAAKPALLAWEMNGRPLPEGTLRLALPGDHRGGRNVRDVVRVSLE